MAEPRHHEPTSRRHTRRAPDWPGLCERAAATLRQHLARNQELAPRAVAQTVAGALPGRLGRWLLKQLERLGWLERDAVLPFDLLDRPDCPPAFRGGPRELVRLAVFGLPGQGLAARDKHRDGIFQQLCAEIMRDAVDLVSLQHISSRVLNHPDAASDAVLGSMLRAFIAQRESVLRTLPTKEEQRLRQEQSSKLQHAFGETYGTGFPSRAELLATFLRLQRDFDGHLAQFEEARAARALDQMRELRRRFPVHVRAADLQVCEEQYDRLLKRAGVYRRQIGELAAQAAKAARAGDQMTAAWVIRRLQAIHTLLPNLLPTEHLEKLRAEISRSGAEHETQEAARELLDRERALAAKIRGLAGIVHRFHELAGRVPESDDAHRRAEANYRRAVAEIRGMDTDWLASLILQLESLQNDLDDPSGDMQNQLDQFISRVRTALNRLRLEIRAIKAEQGVPPPGQAIARPASPPLTPPQEPAPPPSA